MQSVARRVLAVVAGVVLLVVGSTGSALARPSDGAPGREAQPDVWMPADGEECVEDPTPGGTLCAPEIVVTAPDPEPEPEAEPQSSGPDATVRPVTGLSVGAGSDANKRMDILLTRLEQRLEEKWNLCEELAADSAKELTAAIETLKVEQAGQDAVLRDSSATPEARADARLRVERAEELVNLLAAELHDRQTRCDS